MTDSSNNLNNATTDLGTELRRRYRASWEQARAGGPRPDPEAILQEAPESARAALRNDLAAIDGEFANATISEPAPGVATLDGADPQLEQGLSFDSLDSNATGMFVPNPGTAGYSNLAEIKADPTSRLTNYEILGELGRGGMGVVYKARQKGLNRYVALKMIRSGAHATGEQLGRFHQEARAVAHLDHVNIVKIYDIGDLDGLPYFSLEFVDGGNLADQLAHQPQAPGKAAAMIEVLARAMHHAHGHNIIHRDLKPANVLLTQDGTLKISDFGLAKSLEGDTLQTTEGSIMGTPSYMSPEQARGNVAFMGPHSDQYSLGAMLYEMLTGRPPFSGSSILEIVNQVLNREPVPPTQLQPGLPRDLETICLKALQKDPKKRYGDCGEMAEDLNRFLAGQPIHARPVGAIEAGLRWAKRNPVIASLATASFALLLGLVALMTYAYLTVSGKNSALKEANDTVTRERNTAIKNAEIAVANYDFSALNVGVFLDAVNDAFANLPNPEAAQQEVLNKLIAAMSQSPRATSESGLSDRGTAALLFVRGNLLWDGGQRVEAEAIYRECHQVMLNLAAKNPENDKDKANLALLISRLADVQQVNHRDMKGSRALFDQAAKLQEEIVRQPRDLGIKPADAIRSWANTRELIALQSQQLGRETEAIAMLEEVVKLRREVLKLDDNAVSRGNLGRTLYLLGAVLAFRDLDRASQYLDETIKIRQDLYKAQPQKLKLVRELTVATSTRGDLDLYRKRPADAMKRYREALEMRQYLARKEDNNKLSRIYLSMAHYRVGAAAAQLGDTKTATESFQTCLDLRQKLAVESLRSSDILSRLIDLMLARARCGKHTEAIGAAVQVYRSANESYPIQLGGALAVQLDEKGIIPKNGRRVYTVATCYALCAGLPGLDAETRARYRGFALRFLREAATMREFPSVFEIEVDPDLDPLREDSEFNKLLADWKKQS